MYISRKAKERREIEKEAAALEQSLIITVATKSERFTKAHALAKENRVVIGDYRVALSHYLKMIKIAKPEPVIAVEEPKPTQDALIGKSVEIYFGTKSPVITITGVNEWRGGDMIRNYIDFTVSGKANPLHKLYEIIEGGSRDHVVEVAGRKFGYEYGFCDSKTKRVAVDNAVKELLSNLI